MNEKKAREHLSKYDKETIIDLYLRKCYELDIAKEELDKAIVPKFKRGQKLWFIDTRVNDFNEQRNIIQPFEVFVVRFDGFEFEYEDRWGDVIAQKYLFTEEEARAKLKELQNENIK